MDTPDGVFRVYLDFAGFSQLVFTTESCTADWQGVHATEGGSQPQVTAHRAAADAGVLCAGPSAAACAPGKSCVDDPTDTCRPGSGDPGCGGWCFSVDGGTACGPFTCGASELCKRQQPGIPTDAGPSEVGCVRVTGSCAAATCAACFATDPCPQTMCSSVSLGAGARYVDCMGI